MDPKQTSPLGNGSVGGQEGQSGNPAGSQPVFGAGNATSSGTGGSANAPKMSGTLGAENLSTGANVSRTMDSLNSNNQSATGSSVFSKHKFDKVNPNGDILLPSSGPVKTERKPINKGLLLNIAVVVGGILAIMVVVLAIVLPKGSGGNKGGSGSGGSSAPIASLDYQPSFIRYANYVLFGAADNSEQLLEPEYKNNRTYQLTFSFGLSEAAIAGMDETRITQYQLIDNDTFFNTAMSYYNAFLDQTGDIDNEAYPRAQTLIFSQTDGMNFLNVYSKLKEPNQQQILIEVQNGDADSANEYIENSYAELSESSDAGQRYATAKKKYFAALIEKYSIFKANNCVKDNTIDTACSKKIANLPEVPSDSTYEAMKATTSSIVSVASNNVLRGCFYLVDQFNNPSPITFPAQDVGDQPENSQQNNQQNQENQGNNQQNSQSQQDSQQSNVQNQDNSSNNSQSGSQSQSATNGGNN